MPHCYHYSFCDAFIIDLTILHFANLYVFAAAGTAPRCRSPGVTSPMPVVVGRRFDKLPSVLDIIAPAIKRSQCATHFQRPQCCTFHHTRAPKYAAVAVHLVMYPPPFISSSFPNSHYRVYGAIFSVRSAIPLRTITLVVSGHVRVRVLPRFSFVFCTCVPILAAGSARLEVETALILLLLYPPRPQCITHTRLRLLPISCQSPLLCLLPVPPPPPFPSLPLPLLPT